MTTRTAALPAVLLAAGLALAGCGGDDGDPTAGQSTSTLPTGSQLTSPQPPIGTATPGGGNVTDLPAGFPLPPRTTVGRVAVRAGGIAAPLTVADGGVPGGAITQPPASGAGSAGELPAGFPLPPGTTVGPVAVQGGEIAATLAVPDGKQVFDYWKQQLPAAGYQVGEAEMVGGIGEISFSGNGCADGSRLGISGPTVAFRCRRA